MKNPVIEFLRRSLPANKFDAIRVNRAPVYDTIYFPAAGGQGPFKWFAVPEGGSDTNAPTGQNKAREDTNVLTAGQLGNTAFIMTHIRLQAFWSPKGRQVAAISGDADLIFGEMKDSMPVLLNILRSGVFKFKVDGKTLFNIHQPFLNAPPGFGPRVDRWAVTDDSSNTYADWIAQNPEAKPWPVEKLQMIQPGQKVEASIEFPEANPGALTNLHAGANTPRLQMLCALDGFKIEESN